MKKPTQEQMYYAAEKRSADLNNAMMELIKDKDNPLTNADLQALIDRRPEVYGRFSGFLGKLPDAQPEAPAEASEAPVRKGPRPG